MSKTTKKHTISLNQVTNNPWLISLVLALAGSALIMLIRIIVNSPLIFTNNLTDKATTKYTLQNNFRQQASNDGNLTTKTTISPASLRGPIISPNDPSRGADKALINIVYFSDFSCSFCRQQEIILQQALTKYPEQIKITWKDLPENDTASQSYRAAKAGRCAFQAGQFWAFHDKLLTSDSLQDENLEQIAGQIGLDISSFRRCLEKKQGLADTMINSNWQEADALGISGTPYIYINQRDFLGQLSWEDLQLAIETELSAATSSQK